MSKQKATISDWNKFATNPTATENQSPNTSPNPGVQGSTVFKETFVEKVINEEGEVCTRTKCTNYASADGIELTKNDYDQAKARDEERILEMTRRRELVRGARPTASQTAKRSSFQVEQQGETNAWPSRPAASHDSFSASLASLPSQSQKQESEHPSGQFNQEGSEHTPLRPASDDEFPTCWRPPPCDNLPLISDAACRRTANIPPHLRSTPMLPPQRSVASLRGSRSNVSIPPHLRN